jgi:hypothetical protein
VSRVRLRPHVVHIVGAHVDDLDLDPAMLRGFRDRSLRILRVELADEEHDRAAVGERFANELPGLASGRDVIGADVAVRASAARRCPA